MAGGNTPRQKMINMMYLVLTAMLALNVSAEVLDAFGIIEVGLQQTADIAKTKNAQSLQNFAKAATDNEAKVKPWQDKAKLVEEKTNEITEYINNLKLDLVKKGDGEKTKAISEDGKILPEDLENKGNTDVVNNIMIGANKDGQAYALRNKIEEYKEFIFNDILKDLDATGLVGEINGLLNFDFNKKGATDVRTWETFTFEGIPLMSAVAMLTKIQVDVQNSESSIYDYLFTRIDAGTFKFTELEAIVKPISSSAIVKGGEFEAQISLGAYDPTQSFTATLNGGSYTSDGSGKIRVKRRGDAVGMQKISGHIDFKGPEGDMKLPVNFEFQVVEPNLVVSPDKMNVFYLGVENPVSISISGVNDRLSPSVSNGTISPSGNGFIVKPASLGICKVTVTVTIDGTQRTFQSGEFRVKRVPAPSPAVHGVKGKTVAKNVLLSSEGMIAEMPKDFEFNLKYDIKSFNMLVTTGGYTEQAPSSGYKFTQQQKNIIGKAKAGDRVILTDVKASGPGGVSFDLDDIVIRLN